MKRLVIVAAAVSLALCGCSDGDSDDVLLMLNDKDATEMSNAQYGDGKLSVSCEDSADDEENSESNSDGEEDNSEDAGGDAPAPGGDGGSGTSTPSDGEVLTLTDTTYVTFCKVIDGKLILTIPSNIKNIVTEGSLPINDIEVDGTNNYFVAENGVLFTKDMKTLVLCPQKRRGEYTIPNSVVTIGKEAFRNCEITSICTMEGSALETIEGRAFLKCGSLKTVDLSKAQSLSHIGDYAFGTCTVLNEVTVYDKANLTFGASMDNWNKVKSAK